MPLHAPVALDGRWIASVASGAADISTVTLGNSDMLVPNELLGCELRVAMEDAATAKTVFLAGTVISHLGAAVKIHDPGHKIATAWNNTTGVGRVHRPSACFYDLREGYYRGVIDSATPGTWLGQQVTFVTVNAGAFETWMVSWGGSGPDVFVQLGSQSAKVIGADQPADVQNFPNGGFKRLILQGQGYTGAAAGQWYTIIGNCTTEDIARCGSWSAPASHNGGATTFALSSFAEVRDEQIGWWLQPDINCQAWFPIIAVSESNHTVTVAGDHRALGTVGTRFRIYAPPGVATRGAQAGTLPMFAEAASSRCLYKGYRYETAAAGRWTSQGIDARQGGSNFTGQHYTLFRHFDPSLMRFTSLDPIAASQNLWAYCDNNPHGSYDPDGLEMRWGEADWSSVDWLDTGDWDWGNFLPATGTFFKNVGEVLFFAPKNGISGTWDAMRFAGNVGTFDFAGAGKVWDEYWHERTAIFRSEDRHKILDSVTEKFDPSYYPKELDRSVTLYGNGRKAEAAQKFGQLSFDAVNTATIVYGGARVAFSLVRTAAKLGGTLFRQLKNLHNKLDGLYEWKQPPGKSWLEGMSNKLRVRLGVKGTPAELHHWFIPQRQWGTWIPNYIKNQRWNIVTASDRAAHARIDVAFRVKGVTPYPMPIRPFMAMPHWAKAAYGGTAIGGGYGIYKAFVEE